MEPQSETLYDKNLRAGVSLDVSFNASDDGILVLQDMVRNFWNRYGQDHTFELTIDLESIGSKLQYRQQMEGLRQLFEHLDGYTLFNKHTRIQYTSLQFANMFQADTSEADFKMFLSNPRWVIGEHFADLRYYADRFSIEKQDVPAMVLQLYGRDQQYIKEQHDHMLLGGAFPDSRYGHLLIPLASITKLVLYKLK